LGEIATLPISKLEKSKNGRRQRILDAARDLLKLEHDDDLSMRALAKHANVSLATPYNLFGSKQGVLMALLKREGDLFVSRFREVQLADPLDRIFQYTDTAYELYGSDPGYFRTVVAPLYIADDVDLRQELRRPRITFVKRMLREAVAVGSIGTEMSLDLMSRQMVALNLFFLQEWLYGAIPLERARLETEFGISCLLLSIARGDHRTSLQERNLNIEAQLD
jgi:AcrR family transcriptional regulator